MPTLNETATLYHMYAIVILTVTITLFYIYTQYNNDFIRYKQHIRILMPIYILGLSSTIFTGILLMANSTDGFTLSRTLMIGVGVLMMVLEIRRHKHLMRTLSHEGATYIAFAKRIYAIELIALFGVTYLVKSALV
ncbi:MAG: hypothetical protein KU28_01030 [Sulfurovum sp. PC08-66]|nr:MAG: hypothetical protein KU28_01030 [Sulfurovum sp. PC08-66]KIM12540.1 MAG: hypothetical protein KU37_01145 [Sulfuricurvum sp. PC08-66]